VTDRIVLADDHKIVRDGLCALLATRRDTEVVAEAEDGRDAVDLACELAPDGIIMDVAMPRLNGIEATRKIKAESPQTKIIGLSMHHDARFIGRMLEAGASGYLLKDCAFEELDEAIRTVLVGRTYLSSGITDVVVNDYVRRLTETDEAPAAALTPKEREVLQLLVEGASTKEAAAQLHVSVKTIETHRQHMMNKLELHSMAELTKYAVREGITPLET